MLGMTNPCTRNSEELMPDKLIHGSNMKDFQEGEYKAMRPSGKILTSLTSLSLEGNRWVFAKVHEAGQEEHQTSLLASVI